MPPYMERKTRLELATPTLARWCSTTELLPHWWCSGTELNRRHGDFQSPALPTELPERMATPIRFELTIFAVTGRHVKPLHHGAICFHSSGLSRYFLVPRTKLFYYKSMTLASIMALCQMLGCQLNHPPRMDVSEFFSLSSISFFILLKMPRGFWREIFRNSGIQKRLVSILLSCCSSLP